MQALPNGEPAFRVLLQTPEQEVLALLRQFHIGWDLDVVLDYLDEFFLFGDVEGVLAHQHFVHHHPQRPDVDLLVVLLALEDFGPHVQGSPAESRP